MVGRQCAKWLGGGGEVVVINSLGEGGLEKEGRSETRQHEQK